MKSNRGITLIALVITIIVLLILAGVSIAMLTGNNGILTQATTARDKTKEAEIADKINMALIGEFTMLLSEGKLSGDADAIAKANGLSTTEYQITPAGVTDATVLTITSIKNSTLTGTITYAEGNYTINKAKYPGEV